MRISDKFQSAKHRIGTVSAADSVIPIPHLKECRPQESLVFKITEMMHLFDRQIELLQEPLEEIGSCVNESHATTPVNRLVRHPPISASKDFDSLIQDCIILAGGLGSSAYVRHKLDEFMAKSQAQLSSRTRVVISNRPRLAVCMGLVHYAGRNPDRFLRSCYRTSFGIVSQNSDRAFEKGRLIKNLMRRIKKEPRARQGDLAIDWFINKGAQVPSNGVLIYKQ
ncbi:hypothetical protein F66182_11956, partial [Fusarium sp. NRRL 66182]